MKKVLAIILAIALLCIIAVGTTLSYFKDEAYNANTMTVGKVDIVQLDSNASDSLRLYPVTATPTLAAPNNAVVKKVSVKLEANSEDAYVRTVFAFEMMKDGADWVSPIGTEVILACDQEIAMTNVEIVVNNVHYIIGVATYANPLSNSYENTKVTKDSLQMIYLASTVENDFSDAIGGSYEVLVLSQAVQAKGFTGDNAATTALNAAFGEVNATNAYNWFANR